MGLKVKINGPSILYCISAASRCPFGLIDTSILNGMGYLMNGDGTDIGTIYRYNCSDGFEIVGSPTLFCQEDATWLPTSEPTCQRKC